MAVGLRARSDPMNEAPVTTHPLETALENLLSRQANDRLPPREQIERVLTDGYAYALELEAAKLGYARRLQAPADPGEALWLGREMSACNQRLAELRARLALVSERFGRNPLADL